MSSKYSRAFLVRELRSTEPTSSILAVIVILVVILILVLVLVLIVVLMLRTYVE
jgi:hypothetical protein